MIKIIRVVLSFALFFISLLIMYLVLFAIPRGGSFIDPGNPPHVFQRGNLVFAYGTYRFTLFSSGIAISSLFLIRPYISKSLFLRITYFIFIAFTLISTLFGFICYILVNYYGATFA